jgi:nitrogen fixation/metabolism regulation signal transduction histidine kinase
MSLLKLETKTTILYVLITIAYVLPAIFLAILIMILPFTSVDNWIQSMVKRMSEYRYWKVKHYHDARVDGYTLTAED